MIMMVVMTMITIMMMMDDDDDGQVCGQAADEALPRQHNRVLCVILREHLLSPSDLLPRWSILSCRR